MWLGLVIAGLFCTQAEAVNVSLVRCIYEEEWERAQEIVKWLKQSVWEGDVLEGHIAGAYISYMLGRELDTIRELNRVELLIDPYLKHHIENRDANKANHSSTE